MERKVDLEWDDRDVLPPVVYPDTEFVFQRMGETTFDILGACPGERVLDIGCGRAADAIEIAKRGACLTGLEVSTTMIAKARSCVESTDMQVAIVQGVGEDLPFAGGSFDRVMCKGALDHFFDPQKTVEEVSRVLRPGGKAVIAVANFESLSCRLGRRLHRVKGLLSTSKPGQRLWWEPPPDHTYKFDYPFLKHLVDGRLQVEECVGVSLFWGFPSWGTLLGRLPRRVSATLLNILDRLARRLPSIADVIVLRCTRSVA